MHRFSAELFATVIASAVMLGGVLLASSAISEPATRLADGPDEASGQCQERAVTELAASTVEGWSRLCVDGTAVQTSVHVSGLTPGHVYTAWLAYFERPALCAQSPCGMVDLRGENPPGVLGRIGGGIPGATGVLDRRAELQSLVLTPGAQVSILLLHHGPANVTDSRVRARQILTAELTGLPSLEQGTAADGQRAFPHAQVVFAVP